MPKFSWLPGTLHTGIGKRRVSRVQIAVAARLVLADAKRVTHEIAGHEDEIGTPSLGDSPNLLQANEALRADVRVRHVDEREARGGRPGGQGKVQRRAARR